MQRTEEGECECGQETYFDDVCMCGEYADDHHIGSGHSPVLRGWCHKNEDQSHEVVNLD